MVDITMLREDSLEMIEPLISQINQEDDYQQQLEYVELLCHHFHILAAASLYVDCKPEMFFLNLCRAAENWRRINIIGSKHDNVPPPSSKLNPLFGATAARNTTLSHSLANNMAKAYQKDREYEDDYLFSSLFKALVKDEYKDNEIFNEILQNYEALVGKEHVYRVDLIKSIINLDQESWDDAFQNALFSREEQIEDKAINFTTPVSAFAVDRILWLEGLSFIYLAENAGLKTVDTDILYCPPLARAELSYRYNNDWVVDL